ncbi:hypothetical protein HK100_000064 [Physocladia obscura]|uniref:Uncharacterized protein n=1 Tax=Physocladia obscura TaxID=109957 RepID=A0AAD5T1I4_9FUNG|nr:hypothetical protein HK100_000064 [Physocladia obscura]
MEICLELAQQLSPSRTARERAIAARTLLHLLEEGNESSEAATANANANTNANANANAGEALIRPIDVVLADCVPSLLHAAQTPARSASSLAPDARTTPPAVIDMADAALLLLSHLCSAGLATLQEHGWHVDDDGTGRGRPLFINPATGESQRTPPDLATAIFGDQLPSSDEWALTLLFELSTITSPYANPLDGSLCWPARIRFHEAETNKFTSTKDNTPLPHKLAVTVVDVAQDDDEDDDDDSDAGKETQLTFTRHLVLGPWHGIPSFRETEIDLDHPPPGSHLESWYTCAMVCTQFLATRKPGRGKCLLIGLGGGAMASFIGRHWPGINVEAIEVDPRIVKVAERWFGVKCEPTLLQAEQGDGELGQGADEPQHFRIDQDSRATFVRVTNAESFVNGAIKDLECRYDVILLDVYTRGKFPAALINDEFFSKLAKLLKNRKDDGIDGSIIVNAGVGLDRTRVEDLVRKYMPVTKVLLDANASSRSDDDNENSVVVGMSGGANQEGSLNISPQEWKRRATEVHANWPEAPLPPFELRTAIFAPNDEIMLAWSANSMIVEEDDGSGENIAVEAAEGKSFDKVEMLEKDDPAFSMFD